SIPIGKDVYKITGDGIDFVSNGEGAAEAEDADEVDEVEAQEVDSALQDDVNQTEGIEVDDKTQIDTTSQACENENDVEVTDLFHADFYIHTRAVLIAALRTIN